MSTKVTIRSGASYHLYHEIFDPDRIYLALKNAMFSAESNPDDGSHVTVAIAFDSAVELGLVAAAERQRPFDAPDMVELPIDRPPAIPEPDPVIEQGLANRSPTSTQAWLRRWIRRRLELGVPIERVAGQLGMTTAEVADLASKDDLSPGVCAISGNPGAFVAVEPDGTLEAAYGSIYDGLCLVWLTSAPPGLNPGDCLCDQVIDEMVAAGRLAPYRSTFAGEQIAVTDAIIAAGLAAEQSWPTPQIARLLDASRPPDMPTLALLASMIQTATLRACSVEDLLSAWRKSSGSRNGDAE